jgi:rhodanese-related sulfurtransferase
MKKYFSFSNLLTGFLLLFAVLFYLYQKGYILANFESISPREAYALLKKEDDIILLDVRSPQEVIHDGKIKGSILIPLDQLAQNIDKLKKYRDKKIFVYCRSGNRSVSASRLLSSLGFKVFNIRGGINEWKEEGLPVQKE